MTDHAIPRPRSDDELIPMLAQQLPPTYTLDMLPHLRTVMLAVPPIEEVIGDRPIAWTTHRIPGHEGDEIEVTVFARTDHARPGPGILHTYGGGMVMGDRFSGIAQLLEWVERFDAVCVTVEYRLAPEFPGPYPVEDCYAVLAWTAQHASRLGIAPGRIPHRRSQR